MKKAILIVVMVLFAATNLSAITIDAEAKRCTVYNSPMKISTSFGKLPATEEYGIFVNITYKPEEGESKHESFFCHLSSGIVRDGKDLFTEIDGTKIILAEKKWYGWKIAEGVKIQHSLTGKPYPTCNVWVEVK